MRRFCPLNKAGECRESELSVWSLEKDDKGFFARRKAVGVEKKGMFN